MNTRKMRRSKLIKKKKLHKADMVMSVKAEKTALSAVAGQATIDCIGNFIFFSVSSGDAWMIDHRNNYALRLAHKKKILPYTIIETKERFRVEWKERYAIEGDLFIATRKEEKQVLTGYPVDAVLQLIDMITKTSQEKKKSEM